MAQLLLCLFVRFVFPASVFAWDGFFDTHSQAEEVIAYVHMGGSSICIGVVHHRQG